MSDNNSRVEQAADKQAEVDRAAADLAIWLQKLADQLALTLTPQQVQYGQGRLGKAMKRRSPEGFVLDPGNLQMLLPDGRLWKYSRSDSQRFPTGRFYDARLNHPEYAGGRTSPGGTEFCFLGAVIGRYTFGYAERDTGSAPGGLWAIANEAGSVRFVPPDEAFAEIADAALRHGSSGT